MASIQTCLFLVVRTGLGAALSVVFSIIGIGLAWGLFWFSSANSLTTLLYLFLAAAAIGAGLGSFLAWLRVDRNSLGFMLVTLTLAILAGFGGAWGGHEYGLNVEGPCCVDPDIEPMSYAALGATAMANAAVLLVMLTRGIITRNSQVTSRLFWSPSGYPQ